MSCLTVLEASGPKKGVHRVGSFQGCEAESALGLSLASKGLLAIFSLPWLVEASFCSLPPWLQGVLPVWGGLCPNVLFYKNCIRGPPYSNVTSSQRLYLKGHYFWISSHSEVLGVRTSTCEYGCGGKTHNTTYDKWDTFQSLLDVAVLCDSLRGA